ncbi:MazG-like family protein [Terribacillus sp. 179-K 1B1 HS]|uniref:MazG-like family protein n=1 Tax=Terribacillus sp. 179-K 1B1 HS TaxID=3142388 RepID=UPI0039A1DE10
MTNLTEKIKQWAIDRNLHTANPDKQMLKLFEELGELAEGMAKDRPEQVKDSIGDIYVVLTILSTQLGIDIEDCIAIAYDEIKDRKGRMIDGVFVKEADLLKEEPSGLSKLSAPVTKEDSGIPEEDEDYDDCEVIECNMCFEVKAVEVGTWALDKGMCEPCYGKYQG